MDGSAPAWLCEDFLTQCLRNEKDYKNVVVQKFSTLSVVPPGNNFGSCLIRVKIEYNDCMSDSQLKSKSLIIKSELTEGKLKDAIDNLIEPTFYNKFIPEASKFTKVSFVPKSYYSPNCSIVVLADLKEEGFVMADRTKQLDFDHCRLYLEAAAALHSVSVAVHRENSALTESIGKEKIFSNELKSADPFKAMICNGLKCFANYTERTLKFKKYGKLIRDIAVPLWDMLVEAHMPSKVLNTVNQGDPWATNMMFKYDNNGDVKEVKLLDFQMIRYGSPVNDIVFFIWSSAHIDVICNRHDELCHTYLDFLNDKLEQLNCTERLSYEHLMDNVMTLSPLVIMIATTLRPFMSDPDTVDITPLFKPEMQHEQENPYDKFYNEDYCNNYLPLLLEQLQITGVLDYFKKNKQ